jgi:hypothetical protein
MNTKLMLLIVMVAVSSGSVYAQDEDRIGTVEIQAPEVAAPKGEPTLTDTRTDWQPKGYNPYSKMLGKIHPYPGASGSPLYPGSNSKPGFGTYPNIMMEHMSLRTALCTVRKSEMVFGFLPKGTVLVYENRSRAEIPFFKMGDDKWFGKYLMSSPPRANDNLWVKYAKIPCSKVGAYKAELRRYHYVHGQRMNELKRERETRAQAAAKVLRKQWEDEYIAKPQTETDPN